MTALNLPNLIPLAVVAIGVYLLQRNGMQLWHAFACLLLGVVLAGSVLGPNISSILSQFSGGRIH